MNLKVYINIFRFFIPSNLPSPYKNKLIRLLSITVEKEIGKFSTGSTICIAEMQPRFFKGRGQISKKKHCTVQFRSYIKCKF